MSSASCTPNGRLPDANKVQDHLRDIFYRQAPAVHWTTCTASNLENPEYPHWQAAVMTRPARMRAQGSAASYKRRIRRVGCLCAFGLAPRAVGAALQT
jgi:hypothetical protein